MSGRSPLVPFLRGWSRPYDLPGGRVDRAPSTFPQESASARHLRSGIAAPWMAGTRWPARVGVQAVYGEVLKGGGLAGEGRPVAPGARARRSRPRRATPPPVRLVIVTRRAGRMTSQYFQPLPPTSQ